MADENTSVQDSTNRLDELLARKEAREAERRARKEAMVLQVLELEETYEAKLGPRGTAFEIVDISDHEPANPFIVLKLGPGVVHKNYSRIESPTPEDNERFVLPCVETPDATTVREMMVRRPIIANRCAIALLGLYGAKRELVAGKF